MTRSDRELAKPVEDSKFGATKMTRVYLARDARRPNGIVS